MTDAPLPSPESRPIQGAGGAAPSARPQRNTDSVAFRALLERLEGQAAGLRSTEANVRDAADLSRAVDSARASLDDALALGRDLLEAFTQANLHTDSEHNDS